MHGWTLVPTSNATPMPVRYTWRSRRQADFPTLRHAKSLVRMQQDVRASLSTKAGGAATTARRARNPRASAALLVLCDCMERNRHVYVQLCCIFGHPPLSM